MSNCNDLLWLYRLSVQCDNDDGRDDEVAFQFTADKLLSTVGEVCNILH